MKKVVIFSVTIIASLILGLVIYNNHMEKRIHNEKIELGKQNACAYMHKKYGIDFEAVDADVMMDDDIFSTFEGDTVDVTVRESEKEYHVEISGVEESTNGCDDYQAEAIEKALINMIKADIKDFEYDFYTYGMYRQLYRIGDINSLKEVLSEQNENLYVYCVNNEFEEVPVFDFLRHNVNDSTFYSFSSKEIMEDYYKKDIVHQFIEEYAPYITSYRVVDFPKRDGECRRFDIAKYNDLLYYLPYENIYGKPEKVFSEISESAFDWLNDEYEFLSAYNLEEEGQNVNMWIPIPYDKSDKELYFACEYYDKDKKSSVQEIEKCRIIGDYAFKEFWSSDESDVKIALLCK